MNRSSSSTPSLEATLSDSGSPLATTSALVRAHASHFPKDWANARRSHSLDLISLSRWQSSSRRCTLNCSIFGISHRGFWEVVSPSFLSVEQSPNSRASSNSRTISSVSLTNLSLFSLRAAAAAEVAAKLSSSDTSEHSESNSSSLETSSSSLSSSFSATEDWLPVSDSSKMLVSFCSRADALGGAGTEPLLSSLLPRLAGKLNLLRSGSSSAGRSLEGRLTGRDEASSSSSSGWL